VGEQRCGETQKEAQLSAQLKWVDLASRSLEVEVRADEDVAPKLIDHSSTVGGQEVAVCDARDVVDAGEELQPAGAGEIGPARIEREIKTIVAVSPDTMSFAAATPITDSPAVPTIVYV
jgi:hypothetical protein